MKKMIFYAGAPSRIPVPAGGVTLSCTVKDADSAFPPGPDPYWNPRTITDQEGGFFVFSAPCMTRIYVYQIYASDGTVLVTGEFEVVGNVSRGQNSVPLTQAERVLMALEAKIAGRTLTIQQSKVQVGDRSIEYMNSITELLKWRDYYRRIVAAEKGHAEPRTEVLVMRRK